MTISAYTINATHRCADRVGSAVASGTQPRRDRGPLRPFRLHGQPRQHQRRVGLHHQRQQRCIDQRRCDDTSGTVPEPIAVDPSGRFVYMVTSPPATSRATPSTRARASSPALRPASPLGRIAVGITVDPTGRFVFVANASGASVAPYTINPTTGVLTSVGPTFPVGAGPDGRGRRALRPVAVRDRQRVDHRLCAVHCQYRSTGQPE